MDALARNNATVAVRAAANLSLSGSPKILFSSRNWPFRTPRFINHEAITANSAAHGEDASSALHRFINLPNLAFYTGSNPTYAFDKTAPVTDIAPVNSTQFVEMPTMPTTTPVSNTGNSRLNFDAAMDDVLHECLGIDKVKLAFPITVSTAQRLLASSGKRVDGIARAFLHHGYERLRHNGDNLWRGAVAVQREHGPMGFVEFNPSRWLDPTGWSPAPLLQTQSVIGLVWESVSPVFEPTVDLSEAEVRRLDIARDFEGVSQPNHYLMRLDTNARAIRTLQRTHFVSGKNEGWTIQLTNASGKHIRLYDKHRQTRGRAPEGTVRFEVELHKWLVNNGSSIKTVPDITPEAVSRAARYWWHESGFGAPLTTPDEIYRHICASLDGRRNSASLATSVYGYYRRKQEGDETLDLSSSTRRDYEQTLRMAEASLLRDLTSRSTRALNLETGSEVMFGE